MRIITKKNLYYTLRYWNTYRCVDNFNDLDKELENAKSRNELSLIEVKCSIGARDDLGRPTTTALENKENFMEYLMSIKNI